MKRSTLVVALLFISLVCLTDAQQNPPKTSLTNAIRNSFDSEKITVAATAIGFTSSLINPTCASCVPNIMQANAASCTLETGDIRISTVLADVPTSSLGMYITAGQSFIIYGYNDISNFRSIRVTGTSGVLNCTYYR